MIPSELLQAAQIIGWVLPGALLMLRLLRPRQEPVPPPAWAEGLERRLTKLAWFAVLLAAAGLLIELVQTVLLLRLDAGGLAGFLTGTQFGRTRVLRLAAVLLAWAALPRPGLALAAPLLVGFLSFPLSGHAADTLQPWLSTALDLLHLVAAGAWLGGVLSVALLPWAGLSDKDRRSLLPLAGRVSRVGAGAILVLALSGLFAARLQLYGPAALTSTPYGQLLILKLATLGLALAAAAFNFYQHWRAEGGARRHLLAAGTRVEAALLLLVLFWGGMLGATIPADQPAPFETRTWTAELAGRPAVISAASSGAGAVAFTVSPAEGAEPFTGTLEAVFTMTDHFMLPLSQTVGAGPDGSFRLDVPLTMEGEWIARFTVARAEPSADLRFTLPAAETDSDAVLLSLREPFRSPTALVLFLSGLALAVLAAGSAFRLEAVRRTRPLALAMLLPLFLSGLLIDQSLQAGPAGGSGSPGAVNGAAAAASGGPVRLAGNAGSFLVTLGIMPAEPGLNRFDIAVENYRGEPVNGARIRIRQVGPNGTPSGRDAPARPAGDGVYRAEAELSEGRRQQIEVLLEPPPGSGLPPSGNGPAEGESSPLRAVFELDVPVPGATLLLSLAEEAMNSLQSATEVSELGSGGPVVRSTYRFQAPDRMHLQIQGGYESILIGDRRYEKRVGEDWTEQAAGGTYRWPAYDFAGRAVETALLGREEVDGVDSYIVSFLDPGTGARYRFWIGTRDYLVRRYEMMATAHFMENRISDFNGPAAIEPPR